MAATAAQRIAFMVFSSCWDLDGTRFGSRPDPRTGSAIPGRREDLPRSREPDPLRRPGPRRDRHLIATIALPGTTGARPSARWSVTALLVTVLGTVAAVAILVLVRDLQPDLRSGLIQALCTILPYGLAGAFLLSRRPDLPFGWLLAGAAGSQVVLIGTVGPAALAIQHGHTGPLAAWGLATSGLGFVPIAVQGLINVRFPSGRPTGRWGRGLEWTLIAGTALVILGGLLSDRALDEMVPGRSLHNPLTHGTPVAPVADAMIVLAPVVVLLGLVAGIGVVVRYWRATGIERQQLKWRAAGVVLALALFPLAVTERLTAVVNGLDSTLFVATLAIPVVRYRLWAIDSILRRSAVYAAVTVTLVGGYVLVAFAGAALVSERVGFGVGAVVVALGFTPVRRWTQQLVDRLFYGRRNDPYQALTDVGRRLEAVGTPGEVLPAVVAAVAGTLRLPYAAIEGPDGAVLAAHGAPGAGVERWPLGFQGTPVGALVASPRRGEAAFDARDRKVLGDLARQAGPAVRAEALTADLLDSRQRLVTAREEERRRLRRDLHDGLGPMLTGLGLNLDAARAAVARGADPETFLAAAKDASSQVIGDLRELVYDLRPPALDDLGLAGAIAVHAERLGVDARIEADLPALPAAVEVAVLRTAVEAINNAVRHGGARRCILRLTGDRDVVLTVTDDGRSAGTWHPGVGLTAMRERATELGGTLAAGPTLGGGRVVARYPLPGGAR
ncbi:MAG TPA: histidine kinase [Mycobacteriales bacterium]